MPLVNRASPRRSALTDEHVTHVKPWTPLPLRPYFWIPLVCIMAGGGIALEVVLHISQKNNGWATTGSFTEEAGFMHYVYVRPPPRRPRSS